MVWLMLVAGALLIAIACPVKITVDAQIGAQGVAGMVIFRVLFINITKAFELGLHTSPLRWRAVLGRREFSGPLFAPGRPIWYFRYIDAAKLTKHVLKRLHIATLQATVKIGLPDAAVCAMAVGALNGITGAVGLRGVKTVPEFGVSAFHCKAQAKIALAIAPATLMHCIYLSVISKIKENAKHAKRH